MNTMTVGDIDIYYQLVGEGPPLVMIMGYTANSDMWGPRFVEPLAREHLLLLFDNRGAGRTTPGRRAFTIKRFADDTAMLMAELGIKKADILGASMGGMVAQELALNHPGKVDRLVLACTTCGGLRQTLPRHGTIAPLVKRYPTVEEQIHNSLHTLYPREWLDLHPEAEAEAIAQADIAPISQRNARRQMAAIACHHTYSRLPSIDNRTLLIFGDSDLLIPPKNSRTIAGRIPGARICEFAGGGHGFAIQFPEEVADVVNEFLAEPAEDQPLT